METKKIRSNYFIFDGEDVVGRVKTQAQARLYISAYQKIRSFDSFEPEIQKMLNFTAACEDEIGYEFSTKLDLVNVIRRWWPEVYDLELAERSRCPGYRISKIWVSGRDFHVIFTIVPKGDDEGDTVYSTVEDLTEMSDFNRNCKKFGFAIDDYKKRFQKRIDGAVRNVMMVGFRDDRAIIQLADGNKRWLCSPASIAI